MSRQLFATLRHYTAEDLVETMAEKTVQWASMRPRHYAAENGEYEGDNSALEQLQ